MFKFAQLFSTMIFQMAFFQLGDTETPVCTFFAVIVCLYARWITWCTREAARLGNRFAIQNFPLCDSALFRAQLRYPYVPKCLMVQCTLPYVLV